MDFETYMEKYRLEIPFGSKEYYDCERTWEAGRLSVEAEHIAACKAFKLSTKDDSDRVLETALTYMEGAFQSKRARLKKQVTHFMGKFCIVKHENNVLRRTLARLSERVDQLIAELSDFKPKGTPNMTGRVTDATVLVGRKEEPEKETVIIYPIKKTLSHDEGAYGKCSYCNRYSADPDCLTIGYFCDCGKRNGFSGSFKAPTAASVWCKIKELV